MNNTAGVQSVFVRIIIAYIMEIVMLIHLYIHNGQYVRVYSCIILKIKDVKDLSQNIMQTSIMQSIIRSKFHSRIWYLSTAHFKH